MKSKKIILFLVLAMFIFSFCQNALAASLEIGYPVIPGAPNINKMDPTQADLPNYALYIFYFVVYISGFITLIMTAIGAFKYFSARDNVSKMIEARNQIASSIIGLVIMLTSYSILYNINPHLIILEFHAPEKIQPFKPLQTEGIPGKLQSSIYTEIPLGRIIERMFEIRKLPPEAPLISPSPSPSPSPTLLPVEEQNQKEENETPRMTRIGNISSNILKLSEKLKDSNKTLKALSEDCSCGQVNAVPGAAVECSPSPSPSPSPISSTNFLTFKSLGQIESSPAPSQFCDLTNENLQKILDTDKLAFKADFKSASSNSSDSASLSCWTETKRDFTKGESGLQAGSFATPKTGKAVLETTVPEKGYFSFSYRSFSRDPSCLCSPDDSIMEVKYPCKANLNAGLNPGLTIKVDGKLEYTDAYKITGSFFDETKFIPFGPFSYMPKTFNGLDYLASGASNLPYLPEWKTMKVLADKKTKFTFEFLSIAEDPCFYAVLDNFQFTPLSASPTPTPAPSPTPSAGCTCDPCKTVRSQIGETHKEITDTISNGTTIKQKDQYGYDVEIKTNMAEQQSKAKREVRLLQDEIGKLDRMEEFMFECGLSNLITLSDFLDVANTYSKQKWILDTANFWDYIKVKDDWATFFCPVSGTLWEGVDPLVIKIDSDLTQKQADALKKQPTTQEKQSSRVQLGFQGLVDFKEMLKKTNSEISSLNEQLKKNPSAEEKKIIQTKLDDLGKRKTDLEANIKSGEQSIKEVDAEIDITNTKLAELQALRDGIFRGILPGTMLPGVGVILPLPIIDEEIKKYKATLTELEQLKSEIENGQAGGNTGAGSVGNPSEIGSLFEGEIAAACNREVPVGELIDRSRRAAYKIVERLEKLISMSEDLMKKTSDMEILVSQCSSSRCKPSCTSSTTPTPAPTITPTPTPAPTPTDMIPRYECGTPKEHVMCRYDERCLSTGMGPVCYPGYTVGKTPGPLNNAGTSCGNPLSQIFCNSEYPFCMSEKGESDISCCNTLVCGEWENQICCPNAEDSCITKDNEPSCCNGNENVCGDPGNQICCPKSSLCGIGTNRDPFCCYTGISTNTAAVCGEPGHQICCPTNSNDTRQQYCFGTSTTPFCITDPNYRQRTDSAFQEVCVYSLHSNDNGGNSLNWSILNNINDNIANKCNGALSFTNYWENCTNTQTSQNCESVGALRNQPNPNSVTPEYYDVCADCCASPNKVCGAILPWQMHNYWEGGSGVTTWGSFTPGLCCSPGQKCINPLNNPGCCSSSSVVCGEPNKQICCNSNQKCGTPSSLDKDPYCVDACSEPPEPTFCQDIGQVVNSKNIIWDEPMSKWYDNGKNPYWKWARFEATGFYNQTKESYIGGSALMASLKHNKIISGTDTSTFTGKFNVKGTALISFYYKTSSYYNPGVIPLKVSCKVNNNMFAEGEIKDCSPGEMVLEPSTEWKKVEITVPNVDKYSSLINGAITFSFGKLNTQDININPDTYNGAIPQPDDDCVFVALDKIEYLPSGGTECEGNPCPTDEIKKKLEEINILVDGKSAEQNTNCSPSLPDGKPNPNYPACQTDTKLKEKEGIKDVAEGDYKPSDNTTQIEQIGIKTIIEKIVPSIFKDLSLTRETMKTCFYEPGGSSVAQSCELVRNEVGPDGELIKNCCYKECYMQDCLSSCYLKEDRKDYKSCLFSCLAEKQKEEDNNAKRANSFKIEGIDSCRHSLNFYCCTIE